MFRLVGFALATSLWLAACTDSSTDKTVTISASTLPALGSAYVYEGWFITPSGPQSTGRFTVDSSGTPTPATSMIDASIASAATAAVITIEPAVGDSPGPSNTHIVGGDLVDGAADLAVSYAKALGTDFASSAGSYVLATPSTSTDTDDNNQGIWWLVPPATQGGSPMPGLTLPTLPTGWMYEGWVASSAGPVSTGKFTSVSGADSDGTGPAAGPDAGPPFPGEDFINPAMVLTSGFKAVITVEPDPDDSPMPFGIKALLADPIGTQTAPTSLPMTTQGLPALPTAHIAAS